MPSATGVAQAGIGFGAFSTSTRHMRQLAAMRQLLVVAEARHVDVVRIRDLDEHGALRAFIGTPSTSMLTSSSLMMP